jgi:hypothetical protein
MASIVKIEGIGASYHKKLVSYGIKTVETLLKQGASPAGREKIAGGTGISKTLILEWVNHADLWRIFRPSGRSGCGYSCGTGPA